MIGPQGVHGDEHQGRSLAGAAGTVEEAPELGAQAARGVGHGDGIPELLHVGLGGPVEHQPARPHGAQEGGGGGQGQELCPAGEQADPEVGHQARAQGVEEAIEAVVGPQRHGRDPDHQDPGPPGRPLPVGLGEAELGTREHTDGQELQQDLGGGGADHGLPGEHELQDEHDEPGEADGEGVSHGDQQQAQAKARTSG